MGSGISCRRKEAVPVVAPQPLASPARQTSGPAAATYAQPPAHAQSPTRNAASAGAATPAGSARTPPRAPSGTGRASSASTTTSAAAPSRLPHIGGLAVSLAFLLDWAEAHVPPGLPTWAVVERLVKPHTQQDTIRYVDLPSVSNHVLPPGRSDYYFVSHAWGRPFWEMVGLCSHHLRGAVAADTYVWVDIFIINQHPGQQQEGDLTQLRLAVRDAAATLVCSDAAGSPFSRIWCLFEMWVTLTLTTQQQQQQQQPERQDARGAVSGHVEGAAAGEGGGGAGAASGGRGGGGGGDATGQSPCASTRGSPRPPSARDDPHRPDRAHRRSQGLVVLTTGLSAMQRARLYGKIDASRARATVASDKDRILADIAASLPGGVPAFNASLRCALLLRPPEASSEPGSDGGAAEGRAAGEGHDGEGPWDFHVLDAWLALPPGAPHHRALALLGPAGSGKSPAAAAAAAHIASRGRGGSGGSGGGGVGGSGGGACETTPVVAHLCRASDLQALDPLSALRSLAYQLAAAHPQLQDYYAFELGRGGAGGGISFALQAIAGMATAGESAAAAARDAYGSSYGRGGSDSPSATDPVAAAFEALLLTPLQRMWQSYEDAVRQASAATTVEGDGDGDGSADGEAEAERDASSAAAAEAAPSRQPSPRSPPPPPPPPPRLVIVMDGVDEGDSGGGSGGGGNENAMLLLLQEHFPRLPPFVRLLLTGRPLPHIRGVLAHAFGPRVISPADLRPAAPDACTAPLAARLRGAPALAAALAAGGCGGDVMTAEALAKKLWQAANGWMLFLRLAIDVLAAAAAKHRSSGGSSYTAASGRSGSARSSAGSAGAPGGSVPPLATVLRELLAAAAERSASELYRLYLRIAVAPALGGAAVVAVPAAAKGGGGLQADVDAEQVAFLLEVLGAAREPLYLSQLQDLGLHVGPAARAVSVDASAAAAAAAGSAALRAPTAGGGGGGPVACLGSLVVVRGYKVHGVHRSLFEWLASGGAADLPALLHGSRGGGDGSGGGGGAAAARSPGAAAKRGLPGPRRGHAALAAMVLRDVAAARTSQAHAAVPGNGSADAPGAPLQVSVGGSDGGGGGDAALPGRRRSARGPRSPDAYSLHHGVAHVLEAAADLAAAGEQKAATQLLRSLLLDFYFWRCVYENGAAAATALQSLLRHEAVFAAAAARAAVPAVGASGAAAAAAATAAGGNAAGVRPGDGAAASVSGGPAAALVADVARWLQSYHGALLRHPEALLQSALSLPAASPVRAAALTALPPGPALGGGTPPPARLEAVAATAAAEAAQLSGVTWPRPYHLANPAAGWDACLLAAEGRGVTRGLAWSPGGGMLLAARDDKMVHLVSPVSGAQVGILEGHTDRLYCIALEPPTASATAGATAPTATGMSGPPPPPSASASSSVVPAPLVASGSLDGSIALWDSGSRVLLQRLHPCDPEEQPADGCDDGGGQPQSTSFGYSVVESRPTGHSAAGAVECVAFSPDGAWLAAGTGDGSIAVWRVREGPAGSREGPDTSAAAAAVAAATAAAEPAWLCRGAHSEAIAGIAFLQLPTAAARSVGLQRENGGGGDGGRGGNGGGGGDGLLLASCSEDGAIHLWDPRATAQPRDSSPPGSFAPVRAPLRTLRAESEEQVRYQASGEEPATPVAGVPSGPDPWHIRIPTSPSLSGNHDGGGGGSGRGDGGGGCPPHPPTARRVPLPLLSGVAEDEEGPQSRAAYRAPQHHCLAAGPGLPPGCLLAGTGSGPVAVWDVAGGLLRERLRGHVDSVHALALLDGGPHFASGSADCTVRMWSHRPSADPEGWASSLKAALQSAREDADAAAAKGRRRRRRPASGPPEQGDTGGGAATEDQREVEVDDDDDDNAEEGAVTARRCRRPCQWQCVALLQGHTRLVTSLVFLTSQPAAGSGSGSERIIAGSGPGSSGLPTIRLASASVDFSVRVWRVAHPALCSAGVGGLSGGAGDGGRAGGSGGGGHTGFSVNAVALSPDGKLVATAADDFTACLWDAGSGALLATLQGHYGAVHAVAFSRDSRHLATAAGDGDVRIFSCQGGSVSAVGWCRGHTKAATGVAFSHDGFSLASSSEDGTCRIWSIRGFQTALLEGHPRGATSVAWAEDSWLLATGAAGGDPGVQVWDGRMGQRINTLRYHVADIVRLVFGSAPEPPPPPQPARPADAGDAAAAATTDGGTGAGQAAEAAGKASGGEQAGPSPAPARRRTLLLSVDVRGLACVWDAWGGGLLHYTHNVQGADLAGATLLWLQARAMHYADLRELLLPPLPDSDEEDEDKEEGQQQQQQQQGGDGSAERQEQQRRRRRGRFPRCLAGAALAGVYPAGEEVEVVAVLPGPAAVAAVTDKQRLYLFRPVFAAVT